MKHWLWWIFLGTILFVGLTLRVYDLTNNPHGFFCDEADIAYNAYTILHTGKDEYGKVFPLFFQSFGDYKDPVEIYATVPLVGIFGLNEFAARMPAVIWGLLTIVAVYFLTKEIRKSTIAGLGAAAVAATMPWLIHYNRVGFELNAYAALWTWTIYCFVIACKRKIFFFPAFVLLGVTFYAYQPAKLLVPLLLLVLLLTYHHLLWRHRQTVVMAFLVFVAIALPMLASFFGVAGGARFAMVSILSAHLPFDQMVARMFHNYFYQLSPAFFLTGDPTFITRHFVQGLIPLLPVTLPLLALGLLYCLFGVKKASSQLLLGWLLLYPIAGGVVADAPFTSRSVIGAPLMAIFCGIGIELVIRIGKEKLGKIAIGIVVSLLIIVNTVIFAHFYFVEYPIYSSDFWGWQYGAEPIMKYFIAHSAAYDDLAMSGAFNAPDIFLKFYAPNGECPNCKIALPNDIYNAARRQLFAMTPDDIAHNPQYTYTTIGVIYYPNNNEAFRFVTVTKH